MPAPVKNRTVAGMIQRPLLAGAFAATAAAAPGAVNAATDIFLQLDGIQGESTDSKHKDQIDILSYSLGLTNAATAASTGAAAGKLACGGMVLTKIIDKSSPSLIAAVATGKHIKSGRLAFTVAGAKSGAEYYVLSLTDLLVTAIQQSEGAGAAKVAEQVTLSATKYKFQYSQVQPSGTLGTAQTTEVDCTRQTGG